MAACSTLAGRPLKTNSAIKGYENDRKSHQATTLAKLQVLRNGHESGRNVKTGERRYKKQGIYGELTAATVSQAVPKQDWLLVDTLHVTNR